MCIFCSIINKEIPCYSVYEDEDVLAFLDVNPTAVGHTLVVPKVHCASFLDCPEKSRERVFEVAQKLAVKMEEALGCDGIHLLSNMHEAAGQSVEHFHVHLIPRYKDDKEIVFFHPTEGVNLEDVKNKLEIK